MTRLLLLLLFLMQPSVLLAQGFQDDPADERLPIAPRQYGGTKSNTDGFVIDHSDFVPVAIHQTGNFCVSAATVAAYAVQRALQNKTKFMKRPDLISQQYMLSPMLPYRQLAEDCKEMLPLSKAAGYIQEKGDVTLDEWPELACKPSGSVPSELLLKANQRQGKLIRGFQFIFKETASDEEKLGAISYWLNKSVPIIVGLYVDIPALTRLSKEFYTIPPTAEKQGHAMVVVGYNAEQKYVTLLNSYGPSWGKNGLFKMRFADFLRKDVLRRALILSLAPEETTSNVPEGQSQLGGRLGFVSVRIDAKGIHKQPIQPLYLSQGLYQLPRKNWKPFVDRFQLLTQNDHPGEYMTVFSLDSAGRVEVHWPKNEALSPFNEGLFGMGEGDLLPINQFNLVIPSEKSAMQLIYAGKDYVCVLYSTRPLLPELPQILRRFQDTPGAVTTRLKTALGSRLVPSQFIQYQPNAMQFLATFSQGDTVPIILEVEAKY